MAIIQTLHTASQFAEAFKASSRGDQFSYEALERIFECLDDLGTDVEFDPISICCDWAECHYTDVAEDYGIDLNKWFTKEEQIEAVRDYLEGETYACLLSDEETFVYMQF